jgi:hypothetical protein
MTPFTQRQRSESRSIPGAASDERKYAATLGEAKRPPSVPQDWRKRTSSKRDGHCVNQKSSLSYYARQSIMGYCLHPAVQVTFKFALNGYLWDPKRAS